MTRVIRNVMPIRRNDNKNSNTSVILLATSLERECKKWGKIHLSWEIIKIQLHVIRKAFPKIDIIVVSSENFNNILRVKSKYKIRVIPHLNQENSNEMQDIKFGLSSCLSSGVIIICGNILFNEGVLRGINNGESKILIDKNDPQLKSENIGVMINGKRVVNFAYDLYPKWGKIVYLDEEDLPNFIQISFQNGNVGIHKFLFEGLNQFIEQRGAISSYAPRSGYFLRKTYTSGDLKRAKKYYGITEED